MHMAKQEWNERDQKLFQIFRQEMNEVYIASFGEVRYTTERIGGAGKALSGSDAGGEAAKLKTRSLGWPGGRQD